MINLLQQYFIENFEKNGSGDAIEVDGQLLTYSSFYEVVRPIIQLLQDNSIENKAIIVLNDQSLYSYAGILAVNFSNNIFVPIDPSWPRQRILNILDIVKPVGVLLSSESEEAADLLEKIPEFNELLIIHAEAGICINKADQFKPSISYPGIAYIIFTSGSTGIPKGVPVSLSNLNAFIKNIKADYFFTTNDRFLQVYDITFDVTYFSFFIPFCYGSCCCILNKSSSPKFLSIVNDLLKRNITVVSMVPTVINLAKRYLKKETAPSVRFSFFIGDVLTHTDAKDWQYFTPNGEIHNHYGPTEATIACSKYVWHKDKSEADVFYDAVPIGKLFGEMEYMLLNELNEEIKDKVGELALSGDQVVQHYLGQVNIDKFFTSTNEAGEEVRFYKTGDLVSVNNNGNLIFHGRTDHQVKLNGFRIELNEVQLAISKMTGRKNVVVKKKNQTNTHYLSAFIEGEKMDIEILKQQLIASLPSYMQPSEFTFIPQLPLNENGKIDIVYLQDL